ncbi:MAG: ATP phosphoribosyltransferase [Pseudomonadota bacterium]
MRVTIALPSKGRMKDEATDVFVRAGLDVTDTGNERSYRGRIDDMPEVEIAFLTAAEIARELGRGGLDLGITGEDLVREDLSDVDNQVEFCARLGFAKADVVVAVPDVWIDVETMADLGDVASEFRHQHGRRLRIATKYRQLTQQFFSAKHGIQVYRIVESLGATEGAPASGQADIIVDITSTGSTLKANHLKTLSDGIILKSQACLVRSHTRKRNADGERALRTVIDRVRGSLGS